MSLLILVERLKSLTIGITRHIQIIKKFLGFSGHKTMNLKSYLENYNSNLICDFSTTVFYSKDIIDEISSKVSNPKFVFIKRNKTEQIKSLYNHYKNYGFENLDFKSALKEGNNRIKNGWHLSYMYEIHYDETLQYILRKFGKNSILIIDFNDLIEKRNSILTNLSQFLQIDTKLNFYENLPTNKTKQPRNIIFKYLIRYFHKKMFFDNYFLIKCLKIVKLDKLMNFILFKK